MSDRNDVSVAFTEDATVESICEQLKNDWQAYRDALDLSGDYFDRKSQVESVEVTSVAIDGTKIVVTYRVQYSGFRACQDLRYCEQATRRITGNLTGSSVIFPKFEPLERRSTADEL